MGDLNGCINAYDVDTVVVNIRESLEEECQKLLKDVEFLQACLQDEHNYRHEHLSSTNSHSTPSIYELRQCRTKLERTFLQSAGGTRTKPKHGALSSVLPDPARPRTPSSLGPVRQPMGHPASPQKQKQHQPSRSGAHRLHTSVSRRCTPHFAA